MFLLLFLNYRFLLFNSWCYYTNFIPTAELVIPIGIATKEVKTEMECN